MALKDRPEQPICRHCALPIKPGQARWTAREPDEFWHYDCAEEAGMRFAVTRLPQET